MKSFNAFNQSQAGRLLIFATGLALTGGGVACALGPANGSYVMLVSLLFAITLCIPGVAMAAEDHPAMTLLFVVLGPQFLWLYAIGLGTALAYRPDLGALLFLPGLAAVLFALRRSPATRPYEEPARAGGDGDARRLAGLTIGRERGGTSTGAPRGTMGMLSKPSIDHEGALNMSAALIVSAPADRDRSYGPAPLSARHELPRRGRGLPASERAAARAAPRRAHQASPARPLGDLARDQPRLRPPRSARSRRAASRSSW